MDHSAPALLPSCRCGRVCLFWASLVVMAILAVPARAAASDPAFTLVVDTAAAGTTPSDSFALPLAPTCSYDFTVHWGDSTSQVVTTSTGPSHAYASPGTYTVRIIENSVGGFPAIRFNGGGDAAKVTQLANWGAVTWATMAGAFSGCVNMSITATDAATAKTGAVTDFSNAWNSCRNLTGFPLIDTSAGRNFSLAWQECTGLTSFPRLDTSAGVNFIGTWAECSALTHFPQLDTSHGTSFFATWGLCTGLLDFPRLDTSAGTEFSDAWYNCSSLASFPQIDTASGTAFDYAWANCNALAAFPALDLSSATSLRYTWAGCHGLSAFPPIELPSMTDGDGCFSGVTLQPASYSAILLALAARNAHTGVTFSGGYSRYLSTAAAAHDLLVSGRSWNITDRGGIAHATDPAFAIVIKTDNPGASATDQFTLPLSPWLAYDAVVDWGDAGVEAITSSASPTHTYAMPGTYLIRITENVSGGFPAIWFNWGGDGPKVMQIANWGDVTWTTMRDAFSGCHNLTITATDEATAKTGAVTDFSGAWYDCFAMTSFPRLDTSSGTDFTAAWGDCGSLTSFPAIDTSHGTIFEAAWVRCGGLTSFPQLDTSAGTNFHAAWLQCTGLASFPALDTGSGSDFRDTWYGCTALSAFPALDLHGMSQGSGCFSGVTLTTDSYTALLIALAGGDFNPGVAFDGGLSRYWPRAAPARSTLTGSRGWVISDGGEADDGAFVLVVRTDASGTSAANQFTLPLNPAFAYDCTVDWGDSVLQVLSTSVSPTHTYAAPGTYSLRITENSPGGFPAIYFNGDLYGGGDATKVLELAGWGDVHWATFSHAFAGCTAMTITATDTANAMTSGVIDFSHAWYCCQGLTSFPRLDTSAGRDFTAAWQACSGLADFPALDTAAGTSFRAAWSECSGLTSFPLLDTGAGTDFNNAWSGCSGLVAFPLLDTSSGTDFSGAWGGCYRLASFPQLDTGAGTRFYLAWVGCSGLTSFPLLDMSSGTDFSQAWQWCTGLTAFPLVDTSSGTNFSGAWYGCSGLTSFPAIDTGAGTDFSVAWYFCTGLTRFPLIDTSAGRTFLGAWVGCSGLTSFPHIDTSTGTDFTATWEDCVALTDFPTLNMRNMIGGSACFTGVSLSTASYSALLADMAAGNANTGVVFDGGSSRYSGAVAPARAILTGSRGWVIRDGGMADSAFTIVVRTDSPGTSAFNQFTLPLDPGYAYDFTIDWGDSAVERITSSAAPTHTYAASGTYAISISENIPGGFPTMRFDYDGDRLKLLQIANWGDVTWSTLAGAFSGCANMVISATDEATARTGAVQDFSNAWYGCSAMTWFPRIDTSAGTDFYAAWYECQGLTAFPAIDTSRGTDFSFAWFWCGSLSSFPVLDTSAGTGFRQAWALCGGLTGFPALDTSSGVDFSGAWFSCGSLAAFPLLDTSSGEDFSYAWGLCESLTSFPALDTSSGTDFTSAWFHCVALAGFPLLDTGNGTGFANAWDGCWALAAFPALDLAKGTDFSRAWSECGSLTSFPFLNTRAGHDFSFAWSGCAGLTSFPDLDTSRGSDFSHAWDGCSGLSDFPILDLGAMTDGTMAFAGVTLSTASYSNLLTALAAGNSHVGVVFDGGHSRYASTAAASRDILIGERGWTITDGGVSPSGVVAQHIVFDDVPDVATGAPPRVLHATASSGLPVSFTVLSGPGVVSGALLTASGAGTIVIAADQPGDATYAAAPQVVRSLRVFPHDGLPVPDESEGGAGPRGCGTGSAAGILILAALGGVGLRAARSRPASPQRERSATGTACALWAMLLLSLGAAGACAGLDEDGPLWPGPVGSLPRFTPPSGLGTEPVAEGGDLRLGYVGVIGRSRREIAGGGISTGSFVESGVQAGYVRTVSLPFGGAFAAIDLRASRAKIGNSNASVADEDTRSVCASLGPSWRLDGGMNHRLDLAAGILVGVGRAAYANRYSHASAGFRGETSVDADGPAAEVGIACTLGWRWASGWGSWLEAGVIRRSIWLEGEASTRWSDGTRERSSYRSTDVVTGLLIAYGLHFRL